MRFRPLFALAALLLLTAAALAQKPAPEPEPYLSPEEKTLLQLTNEARKKDSLPELKVNARLMKAARSHSANMAKHERAEHELDDKKPADRVKEAGYAFGLLGENVAFGQLTPAEVMNVWLKSDEHRAVILDKDYVDVGMAVAKSAKGTLYWTQLFARPHKPKPVP
ncbi:MAG TPA: CAP domain-containing protein [Gemmataceae bacterium]|nr:CAP domain-containing protein [Gemmataceae bacterium]